MARRARRARIWLAFGLGDRDGDLCGGDGDLRRVWDGDLRRVWDGDLRRVWDGDLRRVWDGDLLRDGESTLNRSKWPTDELARCSGDRAGDRDGLRDPFAASCR